MAAQSSGAFTADPPPVGSVGNSNSLSCRSSQSSGSGHLRPAAEARSRYRLTLDWLMEQLRAISLCSSPRSYRNRSTSLIWRMDKVLCGIRFLLRSRRNPHGLSNVAFLLQLGNRRSRNANINPGSKPRVRLIHIPGTVIHMPGIFIHIPRIGFHMPGIFIHIRSEFLFTSLRNPYPHAPEYAIGALPRQPYAHRGWDFSP